MWGCLSIREPSLPTQPLPTHKSRRKFFRREVENLAENLQKAVHFGKENAIKSDYRRVITEKSNITVKIVASMIRIFLLALQQEKSVCGSCALHVV